jgi:3'-5' exoribonuclease 1
VSAKDGATDASVVARAVAALGAAGGALLIDCEFTCWEDSLRTDWADPARPAELIEIGLAVYDVATRAVGETFTSFARPKLNPVLSDYCVALLHISQQEIAGADDVPAVLTRAEAWLGGVAAGNYPTCGWGMLDRTRIASNARMHGVADPLASRAHIDMRAVMSAFVGSGDSVSRDEVRARYALPSNPRRHRALDDTLDLTHFLGLLLDGGLRRIG